RISSATVWPTSPARSLRCGPATPRSGLQWPPIVSQRYHRYTYRTVPEPCHDPGVAVTRLPCVALPVIVGLPAGVGPAVTAPGAAPAAAKSTTSTSAATTGTDRTVALGRKAAKRSERAQMVEHSPNGTRSPSRA